MQAAGRISVLLLWTHALSLVKSQDCKREDFLSGDLYDSHFNSSSLASTYSHGREVSVDCNVGYTGFFKLVCNNGFWLSKGDLCRPISCDHPGDAKFASFALAEGEDFVFGSKVVYTCNKGYQMVSRINYRRCLNEGWDGVVPVCEALQCPFIYVNKNVLVNGDPEGATYGNVLRFSCKSKVDILEGPNEIHCNEEGEWSGRAPKCVGLKCFPPVIENGQVRQEAEEYWENDILNFTCNTRYKRTEDRPSKCIKVGMRAEWSPTPQCEPAKCVVQLPPLKGTTYESSLKNIYYPGETLRVTCGESFWITSPQDTFAETTCDDNGQWTIEPACKAITCDRLDIENAIHPDLYKLSFRNYEEVTYQCVEGFIGKPTRTCRKNGWRGDSQCTAVTCTAKIFPDADIKGFSKPLYTYKDEVEYVCKEGFGGGFTLTCAMGGWVGARNCKSIKCDKPELISAEIRGVVYSDYSHQEQIQYVCKYSEEVRVARCEEGVWIGITNCTECPKPVVPHGFTSRPQDDKVYYTCNEGYKLFKQGWWGEATCTKGLWSGLEQCIAETSGCVAPPKFDNAVLRVPFRKHYLSNSDVIYECRSKYLFVGENKLRCQDGEWEEKNIMCSQNCRITYNPPGVNIYSPTRKTFVRKGQKLRFGCRDDQKFLHGNEEVECLANGQWSRPFPTCGDPLPCGKPPGLKNGDIGEGLLFEYQHNERVEYSCKTNYVLEGAKYRTCINGEWTGTMKCLEPCITTIADMQQRNIVLKHTRQSTMYTPHSDSLKFRCKSGTRPATRNMIRYCHDGVMELPTCY